MGRFEEERRAFQEDIEELNEKLKAKHLEYDHTVAQLEQMKALFATHKDKVRIKLDYISSIITCSLYCKSPRCLLWCMW